MRYQLPNFGKLATTTARYADVCSADGLAPCVGAGVIKIILFIVSRYKM